MATIPDESSGDKNLCARLGVGGAETLSVKMHYLTRGGRILLVFTRSREFAKRALSLYRPQSAKAKTAVFFSSLIVNLKLWWLLPSFQLNVGSRSVLSSLVPGPKDFGFLLGNPRAKVRKILITHKKQNKHVVSKVAFKDNEEAPLHHEISIVKSLPSSCRGVPEFLGQHDESGWHGYTTAYFHGHSPKKKHDTELLNLLEQWRGTSKKGWLANLPYWNKLKEYAKKNLSASTYFSIKKIEHNEVELCFSHGDFAPWNIIRNKGGGYTVIDWEAYEKEAPSGWDWLNYLIQREILVKKKDAKHTLNACITFAQEGYGKNLLQATGWASHEALWVLLYLIYSCTVIGLDREALVEQAQKLVKENPNIEAEKS